MSTLSMLALDLGAESGRAMLGRFDGERLRLEEIHRFPNVPVRLPDGLHWDVLHLWSEVKRGIALAVRDHAPDLASIGIDTWAVDFCLLDRHGRLLSNPYHYRDSRTDGMLDEAFRRVPRAEIYEQTGIQFLQINSLYQLLAMATSSSPVLDIAKTFLTIPDLLNYWLMVRIAEAANRAEAVVCRRSVMTRASITAKMSSAIQKPGVILRCISISGTRTDAPALRYASSDSTAVHVAGSK
ncbi:FGGY family carbohydrate kinase [Chloroflexota bacterium]